MPIALAIAISAMLHAAAFVMPGWELPGLGEPEPPVIEARLTLPAKPPAASAAPVPARPRPRNHAVRKAAPVDMASVAEDAGVSAPLSAAEPSALPATPEPPAAASPAATPAAPMVAASPSPVAPPWPQNGRIRYRVTYGEGGFVIGENVHEWRVADGHYSIRSVAEPKGLAALRGRTRTQTSSGTVVATGLQPQAFRDQREGRELEAAVFDWDAAQVRFSGGRSDAGLTAGTQDFISLFYQLAWLAPRRNIEFAVATGTRLGRWVFEWMGEEQLELDSGRVETLHFRTRSEGDTTEIWLAPVYGGLPVKIRHVDRKGDVFEQVADLLEFDR